MIRTKSWREPSTLFHDGPLTIVNTKVCDTSFLNFLTSQETETVHAVVEGDVNDGTAKLNGTRNESGCVE